MKCKVCNAGCLVVRRTVPGVFHVKRYRKCDHCGDKKITYEIYLQPNSLTEWLVSLKVSDKEVLRKYLKAVK